MFSRRQRTAQTRYGGNPLYTSPSPRVWHRRIFFLLLFTIAGLIALFIVAVNSPFFTIKTIIAPDLLFIRADDVRREAERFVQTPYLRVIPRSSFWTLRTVHLKQLLEDKFPFATFGVRKQYPDTIVIALETPLVLITWVTGDGKEYYIDRRGIVVHEQPKPILLTFADTPANAQQIQQIPEIYLKERTQPLLLVFDPTHRYPGPGAAVAENDFIAMLQKINDAFEKLTGTRINYIDIGFRPDHIRVYTREGWYILWNESDDTEKQLRRLTAALRDDVRDERPRLEYIDLRFEDRLFVNMIKKEKKK